MSTFDERMIVATKRKLDLPILASTADGELAYYASPMDIPGLEVREERQSVESESGESWYPNVFDGRLTIFIPGNPGAGKSFLASQLITMFPSSDILLFTALEEEDGNFSQFRGRIYKIRMTPENLQRLTLSEIRKHSKNPILLFDDIDKIRDKKVEKLTYAILEDALANGRGHKNHDGVGDVHVIVTSHALNDYRKTKYTLENSDYVALFPSSTTYVQLETMFKKLGLPITMCKDMYELSKRGVRSIIIHKVAPMYIIASSLITLI